ncbi:MAG: hypothetical protein AAFY99_05460 [Pseudomonadota bacterium]
MIRFTFRLLATLVFALACVFAVVDSARSVGASELVFTPFGQTLGLFAPDLAEALGVTFNNFHPMLNDPLLVTVLELPTFLVTGTLAALIYALGYRPKRRRGRFIVS